MNYCEVNNRIFELRDFLARTDYQAIKFAEGELTETQYAPIKKQRQDWRKEINELERIKENL